VLILRFRCINLAGSRQLGALVGLAPLIHIMDRLRTFPSRTGLNAFDGRSFARRNIAASAGARRRKCKSRGLQGGDRERVVPRYLKV
jgi:hypothetical protein